MLSTILPVVKLFGKLKSQHSSLNYSILSDILSSSNSNYSLNINDNELSDLFMLYSDNISSQLHHHDKVLDDIIFRSNHCVFDKLTLKPIVTFYNKEIYDDSAMILLNKLTSDIWPTVFITEWNLTEKHICLFNHNNLWYITYPHQILCLTNINNHVVKIFLELTENNLVLDSLDTSYCYHFLINHPSFRSLGTHDDSHTSIYHLFTTIKYDLTLVNINITIPKIKNITCSCSDEIITMLEQIDMLDENNKFMSTFGYTIYLQTASNTYEVIKLRTDLAKRITSLMPTYSNQHWCYIELYQNDKLKLVLPYIHKYSVDIIKRINMAIRTLSREILNIYHLTRRKQNSDLYETLTHNYKKVLYDLHHIYVEQKYGDYIINNDDEIKDKKSITVSVVYFYLKQLSSAQLRQIFLDRKTISTKYQNKLVSSGQCIDILILTELIQ